MEENYREATDKLRAIVDEIERGELDVDMLADRVREAARLIKICRDKIFKADTDVKQIIKEMIQ
jgi:exodeoxyribonuclease VII small subunit